MLELEIAKPVFAFANDIINAVKYQVQLLDGTVVAGTPEEGIEFYVKDGDIFF